MIRITDAGWSCAGHAVAGTCGYTDNPEGFLIDYWKQTHSHNPTAPTFYKKVPCVFFMESQESKSGTAIAALIREHGLGEILETPPLSNINHPMDPKYKNRGFIWAIQDHDKFVKWGAERVAAYNARMTEDAKKRGVFV